MEVPPPKHCPGVESEEAGKAGPCAGCPNQNICSSGEVKKAAQAELETIIPLIADRLVKIKHIILVISGKGGTGKSTISSTLARCLATNPDCQVGLLDLDICGPSAPRILGVEGEQVHKSSSGWTPVYSTDNLAVMSCGFLLNSLDDAVIWRGPKKNSLIKQFLADVEWGKMDYLIIDTPPGTSDEHISVLQYLQQIGLANLDGAIMVTTPQEVALMDVRKQIDFCKRTHLKILGVIENMSNFVCPKCTKESSIFPASSGGADQMAAEFGLEILGKIPLNPMIGQTCDAGESIFDLVTQKSAATSERVSGDSLSESRNSASTIADMIVSNFITIRDKVIKKVEK